MSLKFLLTGGLGYISHTALDILSQKKNKLCIIDNLYNSKIETKNRIDNFSNDYTFYNLSIQNKNKLQEVFKSFLPDIVIHFAGLKNSDESIEKPLLYYKENILSTINLLEIMELFKCKNLVFSSSATVYGHNSDNVLSEKAQTKPLTPYGKSKLINEEIIFDWAQKFSSSAIILRYFNPIGADPSNY